MNVVTVSCPLSRCIYFNRLAFLLLIFFSLQSVSVFPSPCLRQLFTSSSSMSVGADVGFALGAVACVLIGAIMSGLQVGYFSLDPMKLQLLQMDTSADEKDKQRAKQLVPLLDKHHWLLVTLLVANAAAMETLPILLDGLLPSYVAIILSVTLVLIAGEIIPQALCTNRPLLIGSFFAPFIRVLMYVTAPVSVPMAKLLDYILGDNGNHFLLKKTELHALVDLHAEGAGGHLEADEVNIMKGALAFSERPVYEIMTPIQKCFMIELHRNLDFTLMNEIFKSGYSRIPVYDDHLPATDNVVGLLIVKDLILLDPEEETPVATILQYYPHPLEKVFYDSHLRELLQIMKSGRAHMAVVHDINNQGSGDPFRVNMGIVTLEDVIESILNMEIEDESDITATAAGPTSPAGAEGSGLLITTTGREAIADRYRRRNLPQSLTPNEEGAVLNFLKENVDVFVGSTRKVSDEGMKRLIRQGKVMDIKVKQSVLHHSQALPPEPSSPRAANSNNPPQQSAQHHSVDLSRVDVSQGGYSLYRRGQASEWFTLLIDGSAQIRAGADEFVVETGNWSVLGGQAIRGLHAQHVTGTRKKRTTAGAAGAAVGDMLPPFIPDFSASLTGTSRLLRISRKAYLMELRREAGLDTEEVKEVQDVKRDRFAATAAATISEPRTDMTILQRDYSVQPSTPSHSANSSSAVIHVTPAAVNGPGAMVAAADSVREEKAPPPTLRRADDKVQQPSTQSSTSHAPATITTLLRRVGSGSRGAQSIGDVTLDVRDYDAVPTDSPVQSPELPANRRSGERRNSADEQR